MKIICLRLYNSYIHLQMFKRNMTFFLAITLFASTIVGCQNNKVKTNSSGTTDSGAVVATDAGVKSSSVESEDAITGRIVNVKSYGAVGNGKANDTKAIQKAIDACPEQGTVLIDKAMICLVNTLKLKSNINFICTGIIKQITAANLQQFGKPLQNSSTPIILCDGVKNVNIQVKAITNYEGVFLINSSGVTIKNSSFNGNRSSSGFAGVMMYICDHITVSNSEIFNFGKPRTSVAVAQPGSGIRALQVSSLTVSANKLHNNGDNGLFTITCKVVKVDHNVIYANGLSGIQIAFDATQQEYDYQLRNNQIYSNMADGIDINNFEFKTRDVKIVIDGNTLRSNGFVNKQPTNDGSGIATLIKLSNVTVTNNKSSLSNRSSLYIKDCGKITASNNVSDMPVEIISEYERINLSNNNFRSIDLIGETSGNELKIIGNTFSNLSLPNGTKVGNLIIQGNKITACNINFNVTGKVSFVKNITTNGINKGVNTLFISQVTNGLLIEGNVMKQSSNADCIVIAAPIPNIQLLGNTVTGINNLITDVGAPGLIVKGNKLSGLNGGYISPRTYVGTPNNAQFSNNVHTSEANNIRVTSGKMSISNEKFEKGYNDYGTVKVEGN